MNGLNVILWANEVKLSTLYHGIFCSLVGMCVAIIGSHPTYSISALIIHHTGMNSFVTMMLIARFVFWEAVLFFCVLTPEVCVKDHVKIFVLKASFKNSLVCLSIGGMLHSQFRLLSAQDLDVAEKLNVIAIFLGINWVVDIMWSFVVLTYEKAIGQQLGSMAKIVTFCSHHFAACFVVWTWFGSVVMFVKVSSVDMSDAMRVWLFGVFSALFKTVMMELSQRYSVLWCNITNIQWSYSLTAITITAEVALSIGSYYATFASASDFGVFAAQFVVAETIEQVIMWIGWHPRGIRVKDCLRTHFLSTRATVVTAVTSVTTVDVIGGSGAGAVGAGGVAGAAAVENKDRGEDIQEQEHGQCNLMEVLIPARELGEDISITLSFFSVLPVVSTWLRSTAAGKTDEVCRSVLLALVYEHILSTIGLCLIKRNHPSFVPYVKWRGHAGPLLAAIAMAATMVSLISAGSMSIDGITTVGNSTR